MEYAALVAAVAIALAAAGGAYIRRAALANIGNLEEDLNVSVEEQFAATPPPL